MANVIIAVIEKSAGNEQVGNMWLETKIFNDQTPVRDIVVWANGYGNFRTSGAGRLIITVPDED